MRLSSLVSNRPVGLLGSAVMPLAIDFGISSLKIVQLSGGETPTILGAVSAPTPEKIINDPAKRIMWQSELLPKLVKKGQFKGKRAVCSIPSAQLFCQHLRFSRVEGSDLATMVRTQVATQVGCVPEALVLRFQEVAGAQTGGKTEVICFAAAREFISRLMTAVKACRMEPVGIHPESLATFQAFQRVVGESAESDGAALCLDIGAGTTKVLIAHGPSLVFAKTVHFGGMALDEAVTQQLRCTSAEGRARRLAAQSLSGIVESGAEMVPNARNAGEGANFVASALSASEKRSFDLTEPLEILTDEIAMCLRYHASLFPQVKVSRAVFMGGEARHRALCEHVARRLRLPALVGDPLAGLTRSPNVNAIGVDLNAGQPAWATPVGLTFCPTDF